MTQLASRQRLLAVLRSGSADRIPWTVYSFLLPDHPAIYDLCAQGLTLVNAARPYRVVYEGVEIIEETWFVGGLPYWRTSIRTPVGVVVQESRADPSYGSRWITAHYIRSPEDFAPIQYLFERMRFESDYTA